ncbi:MAG: hypothetical protein AAF664_10145 [Planctomycetota bacterium]
MLDQVTASVDPPAWVSSEVFSYSQLNLDLAEASRTIKEEATTRFPVAQQGFAMVEGQAQAMLQTDVETLLASLGDKHISVQFEPRVVEVDLGNGEPFKSFEERQAFVWPMRDEATWNRLMNTLGGFAAMLNLEPTDEQGFRGYRIENEALSGGVVMNSNYLVLAIGEDVLASVLQSLNNPPVGSDAMRNSDLYRKAEEFVGSESVFSVEISDGGRLMSTIRDELVPSLQRIQGLQKSFELDSDGELDWIERVLEIIPTEREMEGLMGVVITKFIVTDEGLTLHGINELPPVE